MLALLDSSVYKQQLFLSTKFFSAIYYAWYQNTQYNSTLGPGTNNLDVFNCWVNETFGLHDLRVFADKTQEQ